MMISTCNPILGNLAEKVQVEKSDNIETYYEIFLHFPYLNTAALHSYNHPYYFLYQKQIIMVFKFLFLPTLHPFSHDKI